MQRKTIAPPMSQMGQGLPSPVVSATAASTQLADIPGTGAIAGTGHNPPPALQKNIEGIFPPKAKRALFRGTRGREGCSSTRTEA
jgi:hypothetical protein